MIHPLGTKTNLAAFALFGVLSCHRASSPGAPPGSEITPLRCQSQTGCTDSADRHYTCSYSEIRTGVSTGHASRCRPADCASCGAIPVLSGEVVDSDANEPTPLPGALVRAWPVAGGHAADTRTDAQGRYRFLVPVGATVFVRTERAGSMSELHAATVPANGWDVPLDLRSAATLSRLLGAPSDIDPSRGVIVVEFTGTDALSGLGAQSDPPAAASFSFGNNGQIVRGNRLSSTSRRLLLLGGIAGNARVTLTNSERVHCAAQAATIRQWPVEPGTITQIDVDCDSAAP